MATFLITDSDNDIDNKNFKYLLGFQPSLWGIILRKDSVEIFLDSRYFAKTKTIDKKYISEKTGKSEIKFHNISWPLVDAMLLSCEDATSIKVEENLTLKYYNDIDSKSDLWKWWKWKKIEVIENYFEEDRIIKNSFEIKQIKHAVEIIDKVSLFLQYLVDTEEILWKTEDEVRKILINKILEFWWESESFSPIVAFWENSAVAHHSPGNTLIENGPLLVDMWAQINGYCSDFTRTFWVGEKNDDYEEFKKIYKSVKKAHVKAVLGARTGMQASQIDLLARRSIDKDGYWEYFSHSTGHGIWLHVHEKPWINRMSDETIQTGMIFTIEPGIYIPGKFWVRIENIVIAKEERVKILSKIPY